MVGGSLGLSGATGSGLLAFAGTGADWGSGSVAGIGAPIGMSLEKESSCPPRDEGGGPLPSPESELGGTEERPEGRVSPGLASGNGADGAGAAVGMGAAVGTGPGMAESGAASVKEIGSELGEWLGGGGNAASGKRPEPFSGRVEGGGNAGATAPLGSIGLERMTGGRSSSSTAGFVVSAFGSGNPLVAGE